MNADKTTAPAALTNADHIVAFSALTKAGWKGTPTECITTHGSGVLMEGRFTLQGEAFEITVDNILVAVRPGKTTITYVTKGETRVDNHE